MKNYTSLLIISAALILIGQGCLNLNKDSNTGTDGAVWRTDNSGAEWTQMSTLPTVSGVSSISGVNVTSFEVDPSDKTTYYIGTEANGMFYSLDNGASWTRPKGKEARTDRVLDVEVDPYDVCTVYVLKTKRLLKTTDCNRTYKSVFVEKRTDEALTTLAIDWFQNNPDGRNVWLGNTAGEIIRSLDAGLTWSTPKIMKDDITSILISNRDSRTVLVGTKDSGMTRTVNTGEDWKDFEKEMRKEFRNSDKVYGFTQTHQGERIVMNTKYGLLMSDDFGETWKSIAVTSEQGDIRVWSVAINPKDKNVMYYATLGAIYTSVNGGESWSVQELPSVRAPKVMVVHPVAPQRIFVGFAALPKK